MLTTTPSRTLTRREWELLRFVALGLRNAEIAERMNISSYTVRNHLSNIFEKLGARSRTHAVALMLEVAQKHRLAEVA
ncbi:MAG TPA: LuxR C-terminal-related transcriptional regulator [Dehalococcoidia bacterium]|nr:LuxR C-terminal-related transcriptional regulator [Dehalococcoidia bacterium]